MGMYNRWSAPPETAKDIINPVGLGNLVTVGDNGVPRGCSLPFEVISQDHADQLVFHIPQYFAQYPDLMAGRTALALFTGAHGYISAGWYEEPDAPTWDFETVHVTGVAEPLKREETREHLNRLTEREEANMEAPSSLDAVADSYLEAMLSAIGGFRIPMTPDNVVVRRKLSQNRTVNELQTIRGGLLARGRPLDAWLSEVIRLHTDS